VQRNNNELVATYGNLVNRVLTFTYKNFDGKVPTYADMGSTNTVPLDSLDNQLISKTTVIHNNICADGGSLATCHFKQAITMAMTIAQEANRYLDEKAPWKMIKENRQKAATTLYTAIWVINWLKTMLSPFLPFSSQKVHEYLGFKGKVEDYGWQPQPIIPGQSLCQPQPLFKKLDESIIEEETKRLGTL
jgi:methionyl-tRNA synthetase